MGDKLNFILYLDAKINSTSMYALERHYNGRIIALVASHNNHK